MPLPIGTKVFHGDENFGHGEGEVVAHNGREENKYLTEKPLDACKIADAAGIISALSSSLYTGDIYPNVIRFKSGYQDVYADTEVRVIN